MTIVSPLQGPFAGTDDYGTDVAGQLGPNIAISAAGEGITPAISNSAGTVGAFDSFGAVDVAGAASIDSTARVTVTAQTGGRLEPNGTAGLDERTNDDYPDIEAAAISVSTDGTVTLVWNATGGEFVDSSVSAPSTVQLPVTLQLQHAGTTVVGSYSTDGGQDWTTVGTETLATTASLGDDGLGEPLDLGVFHSSGSEEPTTADFSDLFITP